MRVSVGAPIRIQMESWDEGWPRIDEVFSHRALWCWRELPPGP